ncbi:MAG: hypothetical protein ACREIJ_04285 [Nitrospiraceae bacterium]
MRAPAIWLLIILALMVQQGCTASPGKQWGPWVPHVTEDVRARVRTIEVAVVEELPRVTVELPSKGAASGAGRKAGKWSGNWVTSAAYGLVEGARPRGEGLPIATTAGAMLVVTPVVAAAGAVYGAIETPSAETVESQETQVRGVLQVEDLIHRLQNHVLTYVTDRTDMSVSTFPRTANDPLGDRETVSASRVSQPDALLRILVQSIDLRGPYDVDPPLALYLEVQATLVAPSVATPLYTHSFHYVTMARPLTEWTADDALVFRRTVDLSLARLAELMVDDLFLTYPFVHEHRAVKHGS